MKGREKEGVCVGERERERERERGKEDRRKTGDTVKEEVNMSSEVQTVPQCLLHYCGQPVTCNNLYHTFPHNMIHIHTISSTLSNAHVHLYYVIVNN